MEQVQLAYTRIKRRSDSGVVDVKAMQECMPLVPPYLLARFFEVVTKDPGSGIADPNRFVETLAVCCRGDAEARAKLVFSMFDRNRDGKVSVSVCVCR